MTGPPYLKRPESLRPLRVVVAGIVLLAMGIVIGCAATEEGGSVQPQGTQLQPPNPETGFTRIVAGAGDSVGPIRGR